MSTLGEALTALKNAVLLQERLDVMRRELEGVAGELRRMDERLTDRVVDLDKRLVRIETLVEVARGAPRLGQ